MRELLFRTSTETCLKTILFAAIHTSIVCTYIFAHYIPYMYMYVQICKSHILFREVKFAVIKTYRRIRNIQKVMPTTDFVWAYGNHTVTAR